MKKEKILAVMMGVVLIMTCLAGCKNKEKDPSSDGVTGVPEVTGVTDVTSAVTPDPGNEASAVPTGSVSPTEPALTDSPAPAQTDENRVFGQWTADGAAEALDAYKQFIDGNLKVSVEKDTFRTSKGEFTLYGFVNVFAGELDEDSLPFVLTTGRYSLIDCGDDGYPELLLNLVFDRDSEYPDLANEYIVFKYTDGKIRMLDVFQGYYRSEAVINRYGYVSQGGSGGANSSYSRIDYINAAGETVLDYSNNRYLEVPGPVLSSTYLAFPNKLKDILEKYTPEDNDGYYLDIIRFNDHDSTGVTDDEWEDYYLDYFCDAVYTFSDRNDNSVMPDEDYVKVCADNNVVILDWDAAKARIEEHRKAIGLTDTIINGPEPEWTDITAALMDEFVMFPVSIDEDHFPDAVFRSYILESIDTDKDGQLSHDEMKATLRIRANGKGIESLEGIRYFTQANELDAQDNKLSSLDITLNANLVFLDCGHNALTSLDVSNNPRLQWIYAYENNITSIDVSHNDNLQRLYVGDNDLDAIDVSHNPALKELSCYGNRLTVLDISQNPGIIRLRCGQNLLSELDVSNNPELSEFFCDDNRLTTIDVSKNPELGGFVCDNNLLTSLDVSANPELGELHCSHNRLTSLDVEINTNLYVFSCEDNLLTELKLGHKSYISELYIKNNRLTSVDVSGLDKDIHIECDDGVELIR